MSTEQERAELLPCPFCGEAAYFERHGTHRQSCIVACQSCGCSLETGETGHDCGGMWNTRAALHSQDRDALINLVNACPTDLRCHDFHHPKADQHRHGEVCKPLDRYLEAIDHARRIEGEVE